MNKETTQSFISNQLSVIHCAQAHLYERCTEVLEYPELSKLLPVINNAVKDSTDRIQKIEKFQGRFMLDNSFKAHRRLIAQLEETFAPVYYQITTKNKRLAVHAYLSANHGKTVAAINNINVVLSELHASEATHTFKRDLVALVSGIEPELKNYHHIAEKV